MCRLYGFLSNEPTKVDCSLVFAQNALMLQSRVDEIGRDHTDGWGIVTYHNGYPVLKKKTTAAYDDQVFSMTAEKIYSQVIVAHVRKATVGANAVDNTHPFVFGRWTFAHNGTVTGFESVRRKMEEETLPELQVSRKGDTDSEQYFLWLLSRMRRSGFEHPHLSDDDALECLLRDSVEDLEAQCVAAVSDESPRLNFVLTDGITMIACRWNNSLHAIHRQGIYNCEICGIPHIHHHETVNHRAVVYASEPVTSESWKEVENKSLHIERLVPDKD